LKNEQKTFLEFNLPVAEHQNGGQKAENVPGEENRRRRVS
jgi:hypothetical protein